MILWSTLSAAALAESWCAAPLEAHEWGVVRIGGRAPGPDLPPWFARASGGRPGGPRVRDLPADTGLRDLPVVALFTAAGSMSEPIPFAMEVAFADGAPTAWWPPVDARSGSALSWEALSLSRSPANPPRDTDAAWVEAQRAVPAARWIDRGPDSERFLFYEGRTREASALEVRRGDTWTPDRPHWVLENTGAADVHDVVILADGRVWTAPTIPAGRSAGFLLVDPLDREALLAWWRARWSSGRAADLPWTMADGDCVMGRDPAVPVERATDHRLFAEEVDALLAAWADPFFAPTAPGEARLLYREDVAAVDAAMPARLYTDQFHHLTFRRLSVVLVDGARLP